jgi:hypothetical protein
MRATLANIDSQVKLTTNAGRHGISHLSLFAILSPKKLKPKYEHGYANQDNGKTVFNLFLEQ